MACGDERAERWTCSASVSLTLQGLRGFGARVLYAVSSRVACLGARVQPVTVEPTTLAWWLQRRQNIEECEGCTEARVPPELEAVTSLDQRWCLYPLQ